LIEKRKQEFDARKKVSNVNISVGDIVNIRAPIGCVKGSKFTRPYVVIKLFKNAIKTSDGRIWNMNQVVRIKDV
ncbi:hypothetical protein NDU88_006885, partial [Pleurodeles waltl]